MFGMGRFYISTSAAMQGNHGPLVVLEVLENIVGKGLNAAYHGF